MFVDKKLGDIFDCSDDIAETEVELGKEVAIKFVDTDVVVENDVGAFQEVVSIFFKQCFEVLAFLLFLKLDPDDQVHDC